MPALASWLTAGDHEPQPVREARLCAATDAAKGAGVESQRTAHRELSINHAALDIVHRHG